MKTYLTIWFNSNGASPTKILEKLEDIGFKPMKGNYDMAYDWNSKPETDEVLHLANTVRKKLKGDKVLFKLETV